MTTVAIIPARGGSKGVPRKNLVPVCGKPLLAWSVLQAKAARNIASVWVSSDDPEILALAESHGARAIVRPSDLSGDSASSESAWLHALDGIEASGIAVDRVMAMQATSPVRDCDDLDRALAQFDEQQLDSLLSVVACEDFFMWRRDEAGLGGSVNYDWRKRRRRQELEPRFLENGSFYVFRPNLLRATGNRLGGRIGLYEMGRHTMFQIDRPEDIALCEAMMRAYGLDR